MTAGHAGEVADVDEMKPVSRVSAGVLLEVDGRGDAERELTTITPRPMKNEP